jgi:hypothetical protein
VDGLGGREDGGGIATQTGKEGGILDQVCGTGGDSLGAVLLFSHSHDVSILFDDV